MKNGTAVVHTDGTIEIKNDFRPDLREAQGFVGGYIEMAYDDGETQIICNEDGISMGLPINMHINKAIKDLSGVDYPYRLLGNIIILRGNCVLD